MAVPGFDSPAGPLVHPVPCLKPGVIVNMREITDPIEWANAPERIRLVLSISDPTGAEWLKQYGEWEDRKAVVRERLVDRTPAPPSCEDCGEADTAQYQLLNDDAGVPVCIRCLLDYEWVKRIEAYPES